MLTMLSNVKNSLWLSTESSICIVIFYENDWNVARWAKLGKIMHNMQSSKILTWVKSGKIDKFIWIQAEKNIDVDKIRVRLYHT